MRLLLVIALAVLVLTFSAIAERIGKAETRETKHDSNHRQ